MTDIYWLNAVNGSFTNPGDWSGGMVPGSSDTAILNADGNPYTVTYDDGQTKQVQGLQISSNATLEISIGAFAAGTIANSGTILLHSELVAIGDLSNAGVIDIGGGGSSSTLILFQSCTLTNGGTVEIGGKGAEIGGSQSGLINTDNTISGSGKILIAGLVNGAAGVIDGTGPDLLAINTKKIRSRTQAQSNPQALVAF